MSVSLGNFVAKTPRKMVIPNQSGIWWGSGQGNRAEHMALRGHAYASANSAWKKRSVWLIFLALFLFWGNEETWPKVGFIEKLCKLFVHLHWKMNAFLGIQSGFQHPNMLASLHCATPSTSVLDWHIGVPTLVWAIWCERIFLHVPINCSGLNSLSTVSVSVVFSIFSVNS